MIFLAILRLLCFISVPILVRCGSFPSNEVSALTNFKEAIYEDPYMVLGNWNTLDANPCGWFGVSCSMTNDHVTKLNINGSSLKGFIAQELGQLLYLQELVLHGNNLIGVLPKEIGTLKSLMVLDLGKNQLTGPIPSEIWNLTKITKINLESNGFTGMLPRALGNLMSLEELILDRNKLRGPVPGSLNSSFASDTHGQYSSKEIPTGSCHSPQLKIADFSYNFFVGSIPKCLRYLPRSSFQGNCFEAEEPKQRSSEQCKISIAGASRPAKVHTRGGSKHPPAVGALKHKRASKPEWLLALEIVTGLMVGSLCVAALFTALQKWKSKSSIIIPWKKSASQKDHLTVYIEPDMLKNVSRFSRQELEVACEDFSNIIGSSSESMVYKGTMKDGPEIAVVSFCIKEEHWSGYCELYFQKEVADLARLYHENVGRLLGYCIESLPFTRMLVFDYASNGTLYEHLHYGDGCQLSWTRRMKIVIGIARGLKYLHTELEPSFTISELTSNAVYLTDEFSPKLVDFQSWKTILTRSKKNLGSIRSEGAICVLPNSLEVRHLDIQGNIYGFGVLLLEIVSGRLPYCKDKGFLVDWAKDFLEVSEVMPYVLDPELKHFRYEDLDVICKVVRLCIHPDPSMRPSMLELCTLLEEQIDTSVNSELRASSLAWAELALALS